MISQKTNIHFRAATLFLLLSLFSLLVGRSSPIWPYFTILSGVAALYAWITGIKVRLRQKRDQTEDETCRPDSLSSLPEGQARYIDSGRLPNRLHPNLDMREYETSHFFVSAYWLMFEPLPEKMKSKISQPLIRYSGDRYYYILKPYEILMLAKPEATLSGEFVITSQRVIFLSNDNGFEIPLNRIEKLDCSAHLIDFFVKNRRYTIQTDAACYAEKVFELLFKQDE